MDPDPHPLPHIRNSYGARCVINELIDLPKFSIRSYLVQGRAWDALHQFSHSKPSQAKPSQAKMPDICQVVDKFDS